MEMLIDFLKQTHVNFKFNGLAFAGMFAALLEEMAY